MEYCFVELFFFVVLFVVSQRYTKDTRRFAKYRDGIFSPCADVGIVVVPLVCVSVLCIFCEKDAT